MNNCNFDCLLNVTNMTEMKETLGISFSKKEEFLSYIKDFDPIKMFAILSFCLTSTVGRVWKDDVNAWSLVSEDCSL